MLEVGDGMWLDYGNSIKVAAKGFPGVGEKLNPRTERMWSCHQLRGERLQVREFGAGDRDRFSLEHVNFELSIRQCQGKMTSS